MRTALLLLGSLFLICGAAGCGSSRHVTVFAAPGSVGTFARTQRELAKRARALGWQAPIVRQPTVRTHPENSSLTALVGVRVPARGIELEATTQLGSTAGRRGFLQIRHRSPVSN